MTKHAKKTEPLQLVDRRKTATVRIPVPFLDVLASIEHSFFDLCIAAGRQVPRACYRSLNRLRDGHIRPSAHQSAESAPTSSG